MGIWDYHRQIQRWKEAQKLMFGFHYNKIYNFGDAGMHILKFIFQTSKINKQFSACRELFRRFCKRYKLKGLFFHFFPFLQLARMNGQARISSLTLYNLCSNGANQLARIKCHESLEVSLCSRLIGVSWISSTLFWNESTFTVILYLN